MTLKGVVLFPQAMLPLRIFEERYKQMLSDILQKDRMFAVVAERDSHPSENSLTEPPFDVATVGLVRVSKLHSDETSFVMLEGVTRIRIRSIISESLIVLLRQNLLKQLLNLKFLVGVIKYLKHLCRIKN